jgi:hypothetical protein
VCQDNGEPSGQSDDREDQHDWTIAKQRGNGRNCVLPLDQQPKAGDQRKQTEETSEEYREWVHGERFYSRSSEQKSMIASHEARTFI